MSILHLILGVLVVVCVKTENQSKEGSLLIVVKVERISSSISSWSRIVFMLQIWLPEIPKISIIVWAILSFYFSHYFTFQTLSFYFSHYFSLFIDYFLFLSALSKRRQSTIDERSKFPGFIYKILKI